MLDSQPAYILWWSDDIVVTIANKDTDMRILLPVLAVASLAACGGGDSGGPDIETRAAGIKVFKATGSLQCSGGGLSLSALQAQLTAAKVQVRSAECGTDGQPVPAVCGVPDGKIGIFELPIAEEAAAAAAGFKPLSTLPGAKTAPCS
ncbi:MAG TPA: hypothetical protein DDZ22_12470 [Massilia sp.]|nr:hypothetical protein [Massilia sp.]